LISPENGQPIGKPQSSAPLLRQHHSEVVTALLNETNRGAENRFQDTGEQLRHRVGDGLQLLVKHLEGREDYGALFTGQRMNELTVLEKTRAENLLLSRKAIEEESNVYLKFLAPRLSAGDLAAFEAEFHSLTRGLVTETPRHVRTLFIGDCLIMEILAFVVGPLINDGISIEPFPINPRDPTQLRHILASLSTKQFDVVFFSPFSHARIAEIEALLGARLSIAGRAQIQALIDSIISQTRSLLDALAKMFECPIFVHNAGFVARATNQVKVAGRLAVSRRARTMAGRRVNEWLTDYIQNANSLTYQHLFCIDELALTGKYGRLALGRYLNTSEYQHPVVLSQRLADGYRRRIKAVGLLLGRKLIVCDLDNTLWDGVIGEGAVTPFVDRQESLKRLKEHAGVVLSIASKNEPANVRFDGGVLAMTDFVAPQISWSQKAAAIGKIKSTLNLQTRHMVFIDDRADERALVQEAFPDLLTLDAADEETWSLLDLWCEMAFGSSDIDRTRMYQEQALRDQVTEPDASSDKKVDADALRKLALVVSIGSAKRSDLKRVVELINRTNQWNLSGTRITFEQARAWHESKTSHILIASVADRFGDMGTVCASIITQDGEHAEIKAFVLSCRVFGYGVESAMLAEISRRCGAGKGGKELVGHFRANTQNHPCRNMYAEHGFELRDGVFRWSGSVPMPAVTWAELRSSP
jgi:FkbH-like protein